MPGIMSGIDSEVVVDLSLIAVKLTWLIFNLFIDFFKNFQGGRWDEE